MYPCYPKNSRVAVEYEPYRSPADVRRGDVILFRTEFRGEASDVAWRVVGLPSERIVIDKMNVWVNDKALPSEPGGGTEEWPLLQESAGHLRYCVAYHRFATNLTAGSLQDVSEKQHRQRKRFDITVPPDHFLVLGDNRDHSHDSRYNGTVPFDSILARFKHPGCACPIDSGPG